MRDKFGRFIKGNVPTAGFKKGCISFLKGKHHDRNKDKENPMYGKIPWNKGRKRPQFSGEKHPCWNGGWTKNKKSRGEHQRQWREEHKEHCRELQRQWVEKNRDYMNYLSLKRCALKRGASGNHSFGEWELLKKQYDYTCPSCHKKEPEIKLTQDHIIPLSKGGSENIENIQPLCKSCNSRKKDKEIKF